MYREKILWMGFATFLLQVTFISLCPAQTSNRTARAWFDRGVAEKDLDRKIEDLQQAVEYDPGFIQAYYYLGIAYRSKRNFDEAERSLRKAKNTRASSQPPDVKYAINYELAKILIRARKTAEAETILRETLPLKVKKQMLSKISFELGRLLYYQGRYAEALNELKSGENLNPAEKDFFENLITLTEDALNLDRMYRSAEQELERGNPEAAKTLYAQIKSENADFRDVQAKLAEVDSIVQRRLMLQTLDELYQQAAAHVEKGDYVMAIANYESILQKSPAFRDVAQRLVESQEALQKKQLQSLLEKTYAEGRLAYRKRDWTRAISEFEKVLELDSSYLDTRDKLAAARRKVQPDTLESAVIRFYKFGMEAMENDNFDEALDAFQKVKKLNPNYRNVTNLINVLEQAALPSPYAAADRSDRSLPFSEAELDSLYTEALTRMDRQDWIQALVYLEKLRLIDPDYRDSASLLAIARSRLSEMKPAVPAQTVAAEGTNTFALGGGLVVVLLLPLLGYLMVSPMARARLYVLRGNYAAAALIYENALARNPGRLKLYLKLAHIYLTTGRNDETALKVFKTVLKLNLATDERNRMNAIVTNSYLKAGRTDEDAIAVLENALKSEFENSYEKKE